MDPDPPARPDPPGRHDRRRDGLSGAPRPALSRPAAARAAGKRAEEQLYHAQKLQALGQFAGGVAHDFRNQLQVIKGFGLMLVRQGLLADAGKEKMQQILQAADRSERLTSQLLTFSRREVLQPETVSPAELVNGLEKSLLQVIGEDIRLRVDCDCPQACASIDPAQFQQALLNLVLNARDAMPRGGEMTVTVRLVRLDEAFVAPFEGTPPGRYIRVAVRDSGVGMDEQTRQRAFEPFFTSKQAGKGTGLGLSMVYGFVTQSHGVVTCQSAPGEGTEIRMFFPCASADAPPRPEPAALPTEPARRSGTILLVEDEPAVRELVAGALAEAGYTVLQAGRAEEARTTLARHRRQVDLLITDIVLPETDGVRLSQEVADMQPGIPTLYVTGYVGEELARRGLEESVRPILLKPFTSEQLLAQVARLLPASSPAGSPSRAP